MHGYEESTMTITLFNCKGGTGKTTSTINLGKALSIEGFSVLLIDLDPQANLSYSLGVQFEYPLSEVLMNKQLFKEAVKFIDGVLVLGGSTNNTLNFPQLDGYAVKQALDFYLEEEVDFILIDCPPTYSPLVVSALVASDQVLIPFQPDALSIEGIHQVVQIVSLIKQQFKIPLEILGVLPVMIDWRRNLTNEVLQHIEDNFELYLFKNKIRINVKVAESPSHGKSVFDYCPQSNGSKDYLAAAKEILQLQNKVFTKI